MGERSSAQVLINCQSRAISLAVVLGDVTVNRITYCPFNEAGTACILPKNIIDTNIDLKFISKIT